MRDRREGSARGTGGRDRRVIGGRDRREGSARGTGERDRREGPAGGIGE